MSFSEGRRLCGLRLVMRAAVSFTSSNCCLMSVMEPLPIEEQTNAQKYIFLVKLYGLLRSNRMQFVFFDGF